MFNNNIGKKLKGFVKVIFGIEVVIALILGFVALEDSDGLSLLYALIGILIAWLSTWFLYGFGEIIDKLTDIEKNTRNGSVKSDVQTQVDNKRTAKLEKLRSQGLIDEEEYKRALSNENAEV